ncbi:MAG: Dihydropteroate synthase [Bacteroidetes bacterium]|nr:Dihydropteroate synthase [Bacteroidota bacterium]
MAPLRFKLGKKDLDFNERSYIMGVLNVTPDSFYDSGRHFDVQRALDHALAMVEEGADIIDVGGESTRPRGSAYGVGAIEVPAEEELRRVLPVVEQLVRATDIPISVDTYKSEVAREVLKAGASMINDISGFRFDPLMAEAIGGAGGSAVIMHTSGKPDVMQQRTSYQDLFGEIRAYLQEGIFLGVAAGVRQILLDPGIGFGKTSEDNFRLVAGLGKFKDLGYPLLVGVSRKSFIGKPLDLPVECRLEGSLAALTGAILNGASVVRVHDVMESKRAAVIADALRRANDTVRS